MSTYHGKIAVTGLNATDNPGPGVAVLRSLRHRTGHRGKLVGLTYDTLDPGIYHEQLDLSATFLLPYPSQGSDALLARLEYVQQRMQLDVLIPTLDSELPALISLEPRLREIGIRMLIPTREQFDLRAKTNLIALGRRSRIDVPVTRVVSDAESLYRLHEEMEFPLVVKGSLYDAVVAHNVDEAVRAFHQIVARWGVPVVVQQFHRGEEYDVVAVGDGRGGLVGAVPMKKTFLTDKGKGWAGVTVNDPKLLELTARFMEATRWRGPCEIEILRTKDGRTLLLEVNPRFPAWTYLSAGAGQNLPWAVAQLAAGHKVAALPDYRAGTMFVRIAIDQIAPMDEFRSITATGELIAGEELRA